MPDELKALQEQWEGMMQEFQQLADAISLEVHRDGFESSNKHRTLERQMWSMWSDVIRQYDYVLAAHGIHLVPFPSAILLQLATVCEELGRGIVPRNVELARASGRPMTHMERQEISRAVFFLLAAETGEITCASPVKTVANCFNVTNQAVRNWRKRADEICKGIPRPHVNLLEESMRSAGIRYSVRGRGAPSE